MHASLALILLRRGCDFPNVSRGQLVDCVGVYLQIAALPSCYWVQRMMPCISYMSHSNQTALTAGMVGARYTATFIARSAKAFNNLNQAQNVLGKQLGLETGERVVKYSSIAATTPQAEEWQEEWLRRGAGG